MRFDEKKARKTSVLFWGNTPCGLIPKKTRSILQIFSIKNHLEFETKSLLKNIVANRQRLQKARLERSQPYELYLPPVGLVVFCESTLYP